MKNTKILLNICTCFILSRNVTRFLCTSKITVPKLKKKNGKMVALHRVRREDKFMYGPLTSHKEKQTLNKLANSSGNKDTLMDSELWWDLKLAKRMIKSHRVKPLLIPEAKKITRVGKLSMSTNLPNKSDTIVNTEKNIARSKISGDIEEVQITYDKHDTETKNDDILTSKNTLSKSDSLSFENTKPLDVIINNMTYFPILNPKKKVPLLGDKMEILSISSKDNPETVLYPNVTTILSATLSEQSQKALELWKAKLIAEMGVDKFNEFYQEQLKNGTLFHFCIESTLHGKGVEIPDHIEPAFNSLSSIIEELKDIRVIESHVSHEHLRYKGKMDCVAEYRGELCVIDWKKSEKVKNSLASIYDAPVQIAAYIGALNYSKNYPFTVSTGLIVVGYTSGKPADVYVVKDDMLTTYWKKWLSRLQQYWTKISKKD